MSTEDLFRISDRVAEFEAIRRGYAQASAATRRRLRHVANLAYGEGEDERLDLFLPPDAQGAPVHLFVHGGYWRANTKTDYAFVADTVTEAGAIAAVIDYSLMPGARMPVLVDQVRRAARWLAEHAAEYGGDPAALSASGHSAGGHLAFYLAARGPGETAAPGPLVRRLLLVSGIYDLRPIPRSFLQAEIGLTPGEVAAFSPIEGELASGAELTLAVGAEETAPFQDQAQALAARWPDQATAATLPGLDHMTIMRDLGRPDSAAGRLLAACIAASRR